MNYTKTTFVDYPMQTTPITAAEMNKIGQGIEDLNTDKVDKTRTIAGLPLSANISAENLSGKMLKTLSGAPQSSSTETYAFKGMRVYRLVGNEWHVYECVNKVKDEEYENIYTYTWVDLTAASSGSIPTKVSDLENDLNFVEQDDADDAYVPQTRTVAGHALSADVSTGTLVQDITPYGVTSGTSSADHYGQYGSTARSSSVPSKPMFQSGTDLRQWKELALAEDIPTDVSDLNNDSGYLTPQDVTGKMDLTPRLDSSAALLALGRGQLYSDFDWDELRLKTVSQGTDSKRIPFYSDMEDYIAAQGFLKQHQDISGKADKATTLAGYGITNAYTKAEVNSAISAITTLNFLVVQSLPTTDISTTTIYLVPKTTAQTENAYDEYLYVNNSWELIGSTAVDISNKVDKTRTIAGVDLQDNITAAELQTALSVPTKTSDLTNDSDFTSAAEVENIYMQRPFHVSDATISQVRNEQIVKYNGHYYFKDNVVSQIAVQHKIPNMSDIPTSTSQLINNSGFLTQHQDISGKEDTSNKTTSISSSSTDTQYPSALAVKNYVDTVIGGIENGSY